MNKFYFLIALLLSSSLTFAQVTFTNNNSVLVDDDVHSALPIAVSDMNGDLLDDIIRLLEGHTICIDYQQTDGTFTRKEFQRVADDPQWTMSVADIDNNGFNDILVGGRYDGIKVYYADETGSSYAEFNMPGEDIFAQASNLVDINNDGFLDAFVCHDDGESRIWENDKNGGFVQADDWIDMSTTPASDNSGNYGTVWTDFDNDGDVDLYIAKCRQGVDNSSDPRRINALFVNDGNGNFTEQAEEYGLKIGDQSWTADFADMDNDGDFDCLVTNHGSPAIILENDGTGHYTDVSAQSNVGFLGTVIQALLRDMDNDGFVDLVVSGLDQYYFHGNGDLTFTEVNNFLPNGDDELYTFSLGDLDHDGFLDINGGYGNLYTSPSNRDDIFWKNNGNNNNWININLTGTVSNRSAAGTKVRIYGEWGEQIREVRTGESYGISNSATQHFGLGQATAIDFIRVEWPSGNVQIIQDPEINQFLNVVEEECVISGVFIEADGPTTFCEGESVTITAPEGFPSYQWTNGNNASVIEVTESGGYQVIVSNGECEASSNIINVVVNPDETPSILEGIEAEVCAGESFVLTSSSLVDNVWSTDEISNSIEVSEPGNYSVTYNGLCESFTSEIFTLINLETDDLQVTDDTVTLNESALLASSGKNPHWYTLQSGGSAIATGNTFSTGPITATTNYYVEATQVFAEDPQFLGELEIDLNNGYFSSQSQDGLRLAVEEPLLLKSVLVLPQNPGTTTISLFNFSAGEIIDSKTVNLDGGEQVVELDFELPASNNLFLFHDSEDSGIGLDLFVSTASDLDYPYELEDQVTIISAAFGNNDEYPCFFNLEFQELNPKECITERFPVTAYLDSDVNAQTLDQQAISIAPNPTSDFIKVLATDDYPSFDLELLDLLGRNVLMEKAAVSGHELNLQHITSGTYYLRVMSGIDLIALQKIVKI